MTRRAPDGHDFVVPRELAEVAERLGLPLHAGDQVRFESDDGRRSIIPKQRAGGGSDSSGDRTDTVRAMSEPESVHDPIGDWDPRRRAALELLWEQFRQTGSGAANLGDELIAERRREASAEDAVPE